MGQESWIHTQKIKYKVAFPNRARWHSHKSLATQLKQNASLLHVGRGKSCSHKLDWTLELLKLTTAYAHWEKSFNWNRIAATDH